MRTSFVHSSTESYVLLEAETQMESEAISLILRKGVSSVQHADAWNMTGGLRLNLRNPSE